MRIEIAQPLELGAAAISRWRQLQSCDASLRSPFFTPEYAVLVASVRPDVRLAILESSRGIDGFFGLQSAFGQAAMPLGAPLTDYQGVVGSPELEIDARELCKASGVSRFDFTQVPAEQRAFAAHARSNSTTWIADLSPGVDGFFAGVRDRHRTFLYQLGRVQRKCERAHGEMVFGADSKSSSHLETLLAWKSAQLSDSGQPLVWRRPWVREVIFRSRDEATPCFGGILFTLTLGDKLIAANFCLYSETVLHGVLMAHNRDFEAYSPGIQLLRRVLDWGARRGFAEVDFGIGEQLYKRQLGTHHRTTMSGWVGCPSFSSVFRAAQYAVREQIEKTPNAWVASLPGRLMRRLDVYRGLAAPPMPGHGHKPEEPSVLSAYWRTHVTPSSPGTEA